MSVVVPSYRRVESLQRCVEALCAQTLPRDRYEVIVCDDGSPAPMASALDRFAGRVALTVVRQENGGPAAARNEGARHARGALIAFTDDDCVPEPAWLARLVERSRERPGHLLAGAMVNMLPEDPYASATQLLMSSVYDYYQRHPAGQQFYSTSNLAVPADRFWEVGGFSESFPHAAGEDYDFCARWHEAGFPSLYVPDAVIGHAHGHDLRSFCRQHFGYGRALLRVRQRAARRQGAGRLRLERPRFYAQLLTYPLTATDDPAGRRWLHAGLVLLSQVATATGAARELVLGRRPARPSAGATRAAERRPDAPGSR